MKKSINRAIVQKTLFSLSRIIIGVLFIFSGFVKAVDPIGSTIKYKDYLTAFHLEGFMFIVFPLAFILSSFEFLTGINILLNIKTKIFSYVALIFMCIFTPLTFVLALTNPVSDCGCFGDAIILTNWQTFFKNVFLLIPAIYIFTKRKNFLCPYSVKQELAITLLFAIGILYINYYSLNHLPILDFRPYKIGANINEGMKIPEGAPQTQYRSTFILEKNGVKKEFTVEDYPYNDSTWVFIDSKSDVISKGYEPPIHDFVLSNEQGDEVTQEILTQEKPIFLIVSYKINKGNWNKLQALQGLQSTLLNEGITTYCLTSSSANDIENFEAESGAGFTYLTADETMLKTTIRSNPGLILMQNGNIIGKWHYNDMPDYKEFNNPVSYTLSTFEKRYNNFKLISLFLLFSILTGVFLLFESK